MRVWKRGLFLSGLGVLAAVSWGCQPANYPQEQSPNNTAGRGMGQSKAHVQTIDGTGMKEILNSNRGKVLMINFWATWCRPCRQEFPELMRFHKRYREKGIQLVLLSLDDPDKTEEVRQFLAEHKVDFVTYIRPEDNFESVAATVDPDWSGAIPATFVFDRDGKHIGTMIGSQDFDAFQRAVQPLL